MKIRKYKNKDEIQILKLDRLVETHPFNRRDLKNWFWKYKGRNPAGKSLIWVAENKGKLVATFSIIPMNYLIKNKIIKGSHSIAMIVHPQWQNKGLIKFVADKLFQHAIERKIKFIYGYPNTNAYQIHKSIFGYKDINQQKLFYKKLKKIDYFDEHIIKEKKILRFDSEIDKLWKSIKNQYNVCVERSKQFLNWRYTNRPDVKYFLFEYYQDNKIVGYSVLKKYKEKKITRGHIIDVFYNKKILNLFDFIIKSNCNFLYKNNCQEIELWLQGDTIAVNKLNKFNFYVKSTRPFIGKKLLMEEKLFKNLNKNKWYFTMGDTLEIY